MATQDLKTHSDLGEVAPAPTDAIGLWRGSAGAQQLGWMQVKGLLTPSVVTRSLADGAGTLTPDAGGARTIFILSGVASAPFDLTVSNGAVVDQEIQLIVTGDRGTHAINAVDEELAAFSSLSNGNHITAFWSGTTWVRREFSKTWRPVEFGSGAPSGVVTPGGIGQIYRDNTTGDKYIAIGHATSSWDLFEGGGGDTFTTVDDANTAITVGAASNTHRRLTSSSAITLTLSATATVGTRQSFVKKGSGVITVQVTGSSTYKLPGDTAGRTASFVLSGYGYFEVVANSGGSAAQWDFLGDSNHGETVDNTVDFGGNLVYGNLGSVVTGVSGTLTTAAHLGRLIVTSGNITVPTTAGFHCLVKFGGAHTVSFNSTTSAAATTGQIASIFVQSATVIIMTPLATPVAFS